jgi:serine/threonine-protein kinase HipA
VSDFAVARISLWDRYVGAVSEDPAGRIAFEYDEEFRRSGLEISPVHLPLSRSGPQEFPELRRLQAFAGLPGVLADALPDAFGNAVIRRYFEEQGTPDRALSPVQKLLYIGSRAVGALEFSPPLDGRMRAATEEALSIAGLVDAARRVIEGDLSAAVPEIMQVAASAGGARAKALVLWNREANRVRSAFAHPEPGDEPWMIKFDGVTEGSGGPAVREDVRPGPYGRIEYAYAEMARIAGIQMMPTHLLRERDYAHFMTQRFDRANGRRLHMHSLGGLQHIDYNQRLAFSYEEYFRTVRLLRLGQPSVDEAFRRMVFNLAAVNQDDHVKNFAFLMTPDGTWDLSPAFDVTFARGSEWTRTHQMTLRGKADDFTREDLLAAGAMMDVPRDGAAIIDEVEESLSHWERLASGTGLARTWIDRIAGLFRHFA